MTVTTVLEYLKSRKSQALAASIIHVKETITKLNISPSFSLRTQILFSRTAIMFRKPSVKVIKSWEDNDLTESNRIPSYSVMNIRFYNAEHWVHRTPDIDESFV